MIEWKITIYLNLNLKLPHVELTNTTTCNSDSMDSSILNLLNTHSHACDFKIPLIGLATQTLQFVTPRPPLKV